jgi:hypothetical protein
MTLGFSAEVKILSFVAALLADVVVRLGGPSIQGV